MQQKVLLSATFSVVYSSNNFYVPLSPTNNVPDQYHVSTINQFNAQHILDVTNLLRVAHKLNPVRWNVDLSTQMQTFANSCPGFVHGGPSGFQNLAGSFESCANQVSCSTQQTGAWQWYTEVTHWDFNKQTCSTGSWSDCGHFSNMLSPGVTDIGCGMSYCSQQAGAYRQVWCNYNGAEINPTIPQSSVSYSQLQTATSNSKASPWSFLNSALPP
ncbi:hypothetical protein THRCLA_21117 [Thraustotheca clavata]|uniref:SCP domain-containing protein n=1 Tax=Thraustotheca clavata TaxID=74557 RepID=A0A1W0A020_9STRA|nr:hypothetical protein THRCLA_21117 [Thraustotheca clavata]